MRGPRLQDVVADGAQRIERSERILRHVADGAAAQAAQLPLAEPEHVPPVDEDLAGDDGTGRQQPEHRAHQRGLPAARTADQPDALPGLDPQVDAVEGAQAVGIGDREAANVQRCAHEACSGSAASRSASPISEAAATASTNPTAGPTSCHGA